VVEFFFCLALLGVCLVWFGSGVPPIYGTLVCVGLFVLIARLVFVRLAPFRCLINFAVSKKKKKGWNLKKENYRGGQTGFRSNVREQKCI